MQVTADIVEDVEKEKHSFIAGGIAQRIGHVCHQQHTDHRQAKRSPPSSLLSGPRPSGHVSSFLLSYSLILPLSVVQSFNLLWILLPAPSITLFPANVSNSQHKCIILVKHRSFVSYFFRPIFYNLTVQKILA